MFKILVLFPRFMYQVLEKVLELGARSQKRSQVQFLSTRKCTRFRTQVLNLGPKSQKMSQNLGPKAWKWSQNQDLCPRKGPRFRSQVLDLGPWSQNKSQVLGPRFTAYVLENVLDLRPMSQDCVLGTGKVPRIRFYFVEKVLGLVSRFQKRSQIQVYYSYIFVLRPSKPPRFRSQVQEVFLDLGLMS